MKWFGLLLIPVIAILSRFLLRKTYTVHHQGIIVVTGASSGIGEHAAAGLAARGYTVFAGVRSQKDADRLNAGSSGVQPLFLDVTKEESIKKAVSEVQALITPSLPLVALVNNAGVQKDLPVELQSPATDRFTFDVNVFGLLDTTRAFLPLLRKTGNGARIVNVGSLAGLCASPGSATYVGSKFAVEGITDCLRQELDQFGISVSLLEPGYVESSMGTKAHESADADYGVSDEDYQTYKSVFDGFFANDKIMALPENTSPKSVTTDAIVHAITSAQPDTRYLVANVGGLPAWLVATIKWLVPDRLMDILTLDPSVAGVETSK